VAPDKGGITAARESGERYVLEEDLAENVTFVTRQYMNGESPWKLGACTFGQASCRAESMFCFELRVKSDAGGNLSSTLALV
jgi:hypothetical protein